jgi:tetratricopeptide (TPR) repeat protein
MTKKGSIFILRDVWRIGFFMNKIVLLLVGFLFIASGVLTGVYILVNRTEEKSTLFPFEEKLKLAEELLNQSGKKSAAKSLLIYSEILSKNPPENLKFRTSFGHANALQRNKDKLRALEIYKELNQYGSISKDEKEKLSYSLGSLLLQLGQEEEGKAHLDFVLQNSKNNQLRSKTFQSIADQFMNKFLYEPASKNYLLAIQEYPNNILARLGWMRALKKLGKGFDVFEDYSDSEKISIPSISASKEKKSTPNVSFEKAKTYFNKKEYTKAIKAFTKISKSSSDLNIKEKSLYYLAESNFRMGSFDKAILNAEKVLVNEPATLDARAHYLKGLSYYGMKKYDKATASFNTVVDKFEPSTLTENAKAYSIESLKLLKDEVNGRAKDAKETPSVEPKKTTEGIKDAKPELAPEEDFEEDTKP